MITLQNSVSTLYGVEGCCLSTSLSFVFNDLLDYAASFTILHVCMYAEKRQQPIPFNMIAISGSGSRDDNREPSHWISCNL